MISRKTLKIASSFFMFLVSTKLSTPFLKSRSCSVTMAFKTVIALAEFDFDPTDLYSNLFPVNANGEVRSLSVLSNKISGILPITFNFKSVFSFGDNLPFDTFSKSSRT